MTAPGTSPRHHPGAISPTRRGGLPLQINYLPVWTSAGGLNGGVRIDIVERGLDLPHKTRDLS